MTDGFGLPHREEIQVSFPEPVARPTQREPVAHLSGRPGLDTAQ